MMSYYHKIDSEKDKRNSTANSELKKINPDPSTRFIYRSDAIYFSEYIKPKMKRNWLNRALKFSRSQTN
jgi:hypothetical protein